MIDVSFWCPLLSAYDHRPARNYRPVRDHRLVRNHRLSWESFRKKKEILRSNIGYRKRQKCGFIHCIYVYFFLPLIKG